jgi:large subunit ribosomal protein L17
MPGTRKLGRASDHRTAMLRAMVTYLLENGKIETTLTRAKEVRVLTDKMITLGKKGGLANYRRALASLNNNKAVVAKLFDTIAPRYATVNGGYTAVYKLGPRRGDGAEMALITLTGMTAVATEKKEDKTVKAAPKATKVEEVKEEAIVEDKAEEVAEEKAEAPKKATATKKASTAKTTAAKKTTGTKTTTKTTAAKTTKSTTAKTTKTTTTRKTAKAAEDKAE